MYLFIYRLTKTTKHLYFLFLLLYIVVSSLIHIYIMYVFIIRFVVDTIFSLYDIVTLFLLYDFYYLLDNSTIC